MTKRILKVAALQEKAMPRATIKEKMEQRTLPLIEEAAKKGAQIILATELCTTDYDRCYGAKDNDLFKEAETIPGYSTNEVAKLCKKHGVYVIFPLFEKAVPGTSRILAMLGAEVMFCPTAAPGYAHGVHWSNLNIMRAVDNGMFCVYSNRIGQEGVNNYFGESMIVDPMGEVIASGGTEENAVVMADLDLAKVDEARIKVPTLRDMRGDFWMKYYSPTYDKLVG
ncbi:MAG: carbon-nitrogen hydrolase family protein [Rhodobacter sp.]|nr:carbon-nitrogen hydrolase family protein [Rhodobacter sp.]